MSPVEAIFVPFPPKTGTNLLHLRPPPPIVERVPCALKFKHAVLANACNVLKIFEGLN